VGLAILILSAAYVLGTFPTAALVARRMGHDPTREGSGNPGASNVYRVAGARAGLLVFLGDMAKGMVAAGVGLAAGGRGLALAAGAAAMLGHVFPVTRSFRGGRGVATGGGMALVLFPVVTVVLVALWFGVVRLTGKASLASLLVTAGLPLGLVASGRPVGELVVVLVLAAVVLARHAGNLRRLLRGQERSLQAGGPSGPRREGPGS
jgi:glycerol-3-phosphate acyltransferase PlsY